MSNNIIFLMFSSLGLSIKILNFPEFGLGYAVIEFRILKFKMISVEILAVELLIVALLLIH